MTKNKKIKIVSAFDGLSISSHGANTIFIRWVNINTIQFALSSIHDTAVKLVSLVSSYSRLSSTIKGNILVAELTMIWCQMFLSKVFCTLELSRGFYAPVYRHDGMKKWAVQAAPETPAAVQTNYAWLVGSHSRMRSYQRDPLGAPDVSVYDKNIWRPWIGIDYRYGSFGNQYIFKHVI